MQSSVPDPPDAELHPPFHAGMIIYYASITGAEAGSAGLYASANQAVSDAFTSIRVVQAYGLQAKV